MAELVSEATGERRRRAHPGRRAAPARRGRRASSPSPSWGAGKLLLELYEKTTEPNLWGPVFVMDYPAEVSPLARRHRSDPDLVERFEPVVAGRELGQRLLRARRPRGPAGPLRGPGLGARRR